MKKQIIALGISFLTLASADAAPADSVRFDPTACLAKIEAQTLQTRTEINDLERMAWTISNNGSTNGGYTFGGTLIGCMVGGAVGIFIPPAGLICVAGFGAGVTLDKISSKENALPIDEQAKKRLAWIENEILKRQLTNESLVTVGFLAYDDNYEANKLTAKLDYYMYPTQGKFADKAARLINLMDATGIKPVTYKELIAAAHDVQAAFGSCDNGVPTFEDIVRALFKRRGLEVPAK